MQALDSSMSPNMHVAQHMAALGYEPMFMYGDINQSPSRQPVHSPTFDKNERRKSHRSSQLSPPKSALDAGIANVHADQHAAALGYEPMLMYGDFDQASNHQPSGTSTNPATRAKKERRGSTQRKTPRSRSMLGSTKIASPTQSLLSSGSSPKPRRGRRRRSVQFESSRDVVYEVDHLSDLPADEIWYTKDEYDAMKARNNRVVRQVRSGQFEEGDEQTARGLEHKQKDVFRLRRENKFSALNAVIAEQDRQLTRGIQDPDAISTAYLTITSRCQEAAVAIGMSDAEGSVNYSSFACVSTEGKKESEPSDSVEQKKKKGEKGVRGFVRKMRRRASM